MLMKPTIFCFIEHSGRKLGGKPREAAELVVKNSLNTPQDNVRTGMSVFRSLSVLTFAVLF